MSARRVRKPARLLWLAPALIGLLACPGLARAGGCGSHVSSAEFVHVLASLDQADERPVFDLGRLPSPDEQPSPCTGPSCSSRRDAAPTATPPTSKIAPDRGLHTPRVAPRREAGLWTVLARTQPAYQSPSLDRPDRPPRR